MIKSAGNEVLAKEMRMPSPTGWLRDDEDVCIGH
jgi:hypothetical protein